MVSTGIPQSWSSLGPASLINDIPGAVHSLIKLSADNVKIFAVINIKQDGNLLPGDLYEVDDWSDKCQIKSNYKKCNNIYVSREEPTYTYYMNQNGVLNKTDKVTEQKDFGILIDRKLKFVPHIHAKVEKKRLHITKTCLFKYIENFTTINWKFSEKKKKKKKKKSYIFSYFCSKHRLWVLVRTASPRRF